MNIYTNNIATNSISMDEMCDKFEAALGAGVAAPAPTGAGVVPPTSTGLAEGMPPSVGGVGIVAGRKVGGGTLSSSSHPQLNNANGS